MRNATVLYGKYLVQFERRMNKNNSVYYKANIYDAIEKYGNYPPRIITTVSSQSSFGAANVINKMIKYHPNLIISLIYICKFLRETEVNYFDKFIPISQVHIVAYNRFTDSQRRSISYNLSKVIKCLYYDEYEWHNAIEYVYDYTTKSFKRKKKTVQFKRIEVDKINK